MFNLDYTHYLVKTLCFNGKYNRTKLLCTITRLCKEIFLQPLWLRSAFPHIPTQFSFLQTSQLPFIYILQKKNRGKGIAPISMIRSPKIPTLWNCTPYPPTTYTLPRYNPHQAATFRVAARRWRKVYLPLREYFFLCIHIVLPLLLS